MAIIGMLSVYHCHWTICPRGWFHLRRYSYPHWFLPTGPKGHRRSYIASDPWLDGRSTFCLCHRLRSLTVKVSFCTAAFSSAIVWCCWLRLLTFSTMLSKSRRRTMRRILHCGWVLNGHWVVAWYSLTGERWRSKSRVFAVSCERLSGRRRLSQELEWILTNWISNLISIEQMPIDCHYSIQCG